MVHIKKKKLYKINIGENKKKLQKSKQGSHLDSDLNKI